MTLDTQNLTRDVITYLRDTDIGKLQSVVQNRKFECSCDSMLAKWNITKLKFNMRVNFNNEPITLVITILSLANKMNIKVYARKTEPCDIEINSENIMDDLKLKLLGLVVKDYFAFKEALV